MKRLLLTISSLLFVYLIGFVLLYFGQEKFIFIDEALPEDHQFEFEKPFREINLKGVSDGNLNAILFEAQNAKGLILYFHGNRGNITRWGAIVEPFTDYGYDVLVMDYRGFGKSTGPRNQSIILADALQFYQWATEEYSEDSVILYGRSLGTGIGSFLAKEGNPKMLILETPYYSLSEVAKRYYPIYPAKLALRYNFRSFAYLEESSCPIFIFHGTEDTIVPYEQGVQLAEHLKDKELELITIEGGEHRNLADFPLYHERIGQILK